MKILIIKTGALGDVVRSSFLAQALKDKYRPRNPEVIWITAKNAKNLLVTNPYIDKVIVEEDKNLIRNQTFDVVINLEEAPEISKFASTIKSKKFIGTFINSKKELDYTSESRYWLNMSKISKLGKEKADALKIKNKKTHRQILAEMLSVNPKKYTPFFRLTKKQRTIANVFLRRHKLSRCDLIVGMNTGAADRWPKSLSTKKTAELIDKIYKKHKANILLFGGPNEFKRNKEIIRLSKSPIIDTGCGNDLVEFPALVSVCNIFITTDSLGLHIALALKRKTLALIGPTSFSEVDMYNLGEKITPDSKCLCCYKQDCKSMKKISLDKILKLISLMRKQKITFLITAFKEPKTIGKAIETAINQKTNYKYDILISAPDKETLEEAKKYSKKHRNVKIFEDLGKGKSYALNMAFKKLKTDILILSDGDVFINEKAIEDLSNLFLDPEIGCATGRPIPTENKRTKYGYWANFLFDSAHRLRKEAFEKNNFIECSGYLFAFRKKFINQIPLDVAEDSVIPYIFWEKGYKIGYAEHAKVYVRNVDNWKDWLDQKIRTGKAHETLYKYVDIKTTPRVKTFKNESRGVSWLFTYPKNLREYFWNLELVFARLFMWVSVFLDTKIKNRHYGDAWQRVESTK